VGDMTWSGGQAAQVRARLRFGGGDKVGGVTDGHGE
jgi:hypothetical protein